MAEFPTLPDIVDAARANLPEEIWEWIEGGTSGEQSLTANREAFDRIFFRSDMLSGSGFPDLRTEIFGIPSSLPVFIAPFGADGAMHEERYLGVARAIAATGITSIISETSTDSLEDIAAACAGQQGMVQVSMLGPDEHVLHYAERAAAAGYRGLCLVTGPPATYWRERMKRFRVDVAAHSGAGNQARGAASPRTFSGESRVPRTWENFAALTDRLEIPWILKGVLDPEVARRIVDLGAAGVYVSNFGGRNLDGLRPPIDVLGEIVGAVDGRVPVYVDSGFRRGTDVVKALALGATAVGFGRMGAWSLAAGGQAAVEAAIGLLRDEMLSVIGVLGANRAADLSPDHLHRT